jgi:hypothetical protein
METGPRRLRKSERKQVLILAQCRRRGGISDPVTIVDLSAEGCCISYPGSTLKVGQQVSIKPATMEGLAGTVCWVSAEGAGIEFDRPLYAPVVEHLQREYAGFGPSRPQINKPRAKSAFKPV